MTVIAYGRRFVLRCACRSCDRRSRIRNVDVLTAQEQGAARLTDEQLLEHARTLGRPIFTHDIRFCAMAERWQAESRAFAGLIFSHLLQMSIGDCVRDLELIAKATDPADWINTVLRLPL